MEPVLRHSVHTLVFRSLKRSHDMFLSEEGQPVPEDDLALEHKIACKINDEHYMVKDMQPPNETVAKLVAKTAIGGGPQSDVSQKVPVKPSMEEILPKDTRIPRVGESVAEPIMDSSQALVVSKGTQQLVQRKALLTVKPQWHPPWKLMRVISGHLGWVRCIAMDPSNEWFVTGSGDRTIKLWDLGSGRLKLTLTGHISSVRALTVSPRQPYLFSAGEDKQVKCWDLECNKVIRHYHGHLSAVYAMSLHPTLDILITGGRDASARVSQ